MHLSEVGAENTFLRIAVRFVSGAKSLLYETLLDGKVPFFPGEDTTFPLNEKGDGKAIPPPQGGDNNGKGKFGDCPGVRGGGGCRCVESRSEVARKPTDVRQPLPPHADFFFDLSPRKTSAGGHNLCNLIEKPRGGGGPRGIEKPEIQRSWRAEIFRHPTSHAQYLQIQSCNVR